MELKDLKSAWDKFSSKDADKRQLGEDAILDMLKKRTKNMIERIDRNIKTGFAVLFALTLFLVLDDLFITPPIVEQEGTEIPVWILIVNTINTLFIFSTFIYFSIRYHFVKKGYSQTSDLKNVLISIIKILNSYRKLFYVALFILLLVLGVNFISGMIVGFEVAAHRQGGEISDLNVLQVASSIALGIVILVAVTIGLFIFFRWGFRRLYGNYIQKLNDTLQELDEIE